MDNSQILHAWDWSYFLGVYKEQYMNFKNLRLWLISLIFIFPLISGCFSTGAISEKYIGPRVHSKSTGEGKTTFNFTYKGKNFSAFVGPDGKYHAKERGRK